MAALGSVRARARAGCRTAMSAACTPPTRKMALEARARHLYAPHGRREPVGRCRRRRSSRPIRAMRRRCSSRRKTRSIATRPSTRSPTTSRTSDGDAALSIYALRLGDDALILGQRLSRMVRPRADAGGRSLARQYRARSDRPGDAFPRRSPARSRARAATPTRSPSIATCWTSRNCLLVEQPNGDFAQTIARQFLFSNWQELLFARAERARSDAALRRDRRQGGEGSHLSRRARQRMGGAPRRRHRGEPARA